jgi:hypothetical protein
MKWFKHDSNAQMNAKLRRVRAKYGMEGYGIYWYCLELIAQNVDKNNLTFALEHDSELISIDTGIHPEIIQEMMQEFVKLELFENVKGIIKCIRLASRSDEYTQKLINNMKNNPDIIPILSRQCRDKVRSNRIEKNRLEQNKDLSKSDDLDFSEFWKNYPRKESKKKSQQIWNHLSLTKKKKILLDLKTRYQDTDPKYIPIPTTYLNGERWEDEMPIVMTESRQFGFGNDL